MIPTKMMLHSLAVHRLRRMNLHSLPEIGHLEYTQGQKLAKWMREACPMGFFSPLRISRLKFECLLVAIREQWPCMDPMGTTPLKFIIVPWKRDRFFKRNLVFQPPFFGTTLVEKQTTLTWFFPKNRRPPLFTRVNHLIGKPTGTWKWFFSDVDLSVCFSLRCHPNPLGEFLWLKICGFGCSFPKKTFLPNNLNITLSTPKGKQNAQKNFASRKARRMAEAPLFVSYLPPYHHYYHPNYCPQPFQLVCWGRFVNLDCWDQICTSPSDVPARTAETRVCQANYPQPLPSWTRRTKTCWGGKKSRFVHVCFGDFFNHKVLEIWNKTKTLYQKLDFGWLERKTSRSKLDTLFPCLGSTELFGTGFQLPKSSRFESNSTQHGVVCGLRDWSSRTDSPLVLSTRWFFVTFLGMVSENVTRNQWLVVTSK